MALRMGQSRKLGMRMMPRKRRKRKPKGKLNRLNRLQMEMGKNLLQDARAAMESVQVAIAAMESFQVVMAVIL